MFWASARSFRSTALRVSLLPVSYTHLAATGHPNQELLDACEAYLKTAESGEKNDDVVDRLIAELKKVIAAGGETRGSNSIEVNSEYINDILSSRDALLNG